MIRSGNYGGILLTKASTQTALFRKKDRTSPRPLYLYAPTTTAKFVYKSDEDFKSWEHLTIGS